jgi:hypothetical protein
LFSRSTEGPPFADFQDFREIAPYHEYPAKLMPYLIFMEKAL